MIERFLLAGDFVLGLILGIALGLLLVGLFYGLPRLWWAWVDRHPVADVDELVDLDRCDICLVVLTDDIEAITCDAHRYCGNCDDASNRCTACAYARGMALIEERA